MMQRELFGDLSTGGDGATANVAAHHRCRVSDPTTSHEAAEEVASSAKALQRLFLAALRTAGIPLTANELAHRATEGRSDVMPESVRKRAGELVKDGRIVVAGTRACGITGRNARTFIIKGDQC